MAKVSHLSDYIQRKRNRLKVLEGASKSSMQDLGTRLQKALTEPSLSNSLKIGRSVFNSSTWISKSGIRLLKPLEPSFMEKIHFLDLERSQYILNAVLNKEPLDPKEFPHKEIFRTIFIDLEASHLDGNYKPITKVPKINASVLLVSGVLNEIFTTPAFERGARYLKEKYGINYDYCPTAGTKSTKQNSKMIKNHMDSLLKKDPNDNVWVFAFSKGGIDFLHFLNSHGTQYAQQISGISCVATPILGSDRVNHKLLKFLNKIHDLDKNKLYQYLDTHFDLLFKEFQESMSQEYQQSWFENNFAGLPDNIFYTALGLEASWKDSHIWMMLTKLLFQSDSKNDGIVDIQNAQYPEYFHGHNYGIIPGHHLIGTRSSDFIQEALIEAHIVMNHYLGLLS